MKYKKVTEDEVLQVLINNSVNLFNAGYAIPSTMIADSLHTSLYQVRKHLKSLKEKDLVCVMYNPPTENGYLPCVGFGITEKCEELDAYKKAYQEELDIEEAIFLKGEK